MTWRNLVRCWMPSVYQGGRKDGHGQVSPIARDCPDNAEFFKSNVDIGAQRSSSQDAPKPAPVDSIATPPLTPPGIAVAGLKNHGAAAATSSSSDDLDDALHWSRPCSFVSAERREATSKCCKTGTKTLERSPYPEFFAGLHRSLLANISCCDPGTDPLTAFISTTSVIQRSPPNPLDPS